MATHSEFSSYVLPPKEEMYDVLLQGLKRFSDDLQTGLTDSSAIGYGWSPAPSAAKISAPRLLRPKPPHLSFSLREAELRPNPTVPTVQSARSPGSTMTNMAEEAQLPRMAHNGGAHTARELHASKDSNISLPTPKSSRQRSQKTLNAGGPNGPGIGPGNGGPGSGGARVMRSLKSSAPKRGYQQLQDDEKTKPMNPNPLPPLSPRVLPAMQKQPRSLEEHIFNASQRLLVPGKPTLLWKTMDSDADYRQLRTGEYFNHFQQNRVLTTKAGLAQSLKDYAASSGVNVDSFFPRCYDTAQKSEREDFLLDFRRSCVLRIALLHRRMRRDQQEGFASSYLCNETILELCYQVLHRWMLDLDPSHLDEETSKKTNLSEETWEAVVLYSDLVQSELLHGTAQRKHHMTIPKRDGEEHAEQRVLKQWPEFVSHRWGHLEDLQESLENVLMRLESLFPQWSLHGGWMGRNVWIVKPGTNSKGSGIECFSRISDLLQHCDRMPNRMVQKYVERPLLLFSGRKFDIRQWVLVKSVQPLKIFLFSECYLRLCNGMYDLGDLQNREKHISNWQVNKHGKNVVEGAVVSLQDFRTELEALTGRQDYWERHLLPQLKHIVVEVMRSGRESLTPRAESFELFGFDVMVDEAMKLWLLEVNLSPGCESRTTFMDKMLARMSQRLVEVAVLGMEDPDGEEPDWIKICDDGHEAPGAASTARSEDLRIQGTPLRIPKVKGVEKPTAKAGSKAGVAFVTAEEEVNQHESKEKVRKGTGYVSLSELPDDEEEEQREVSFQVEPQAAKTEGSSKPVRKGTGFLHASDLPVSDDEDEDEGGVRFDAEADRSGGETKGKVRKGTGYVSLSELPDDDEEEQREVSFQVEPQAAKTEGSSKPVRKGTGFLHASDLPVSDDEDEDAGGVRFDAEADRSGGETKGKVRKGTGYVSLSELPDDDEEEQREVSFQVDPQAAKTEGSSKPVRKGTGFLNASDLPPSDDEDEDEGGVRFDAEAVRSGGETKGKVRKGTGYVSLSELPDDEEDPARTLSFKAKKGNEGETKPKVRQGTGSVAISELPPSDSEDEEDERHVDFTSSVKGQPSGGANHKVRRGTGFLSLSDLPPSDDEDDAGTGPAVSFEVAEKHGQQVAAKAKVRKGTGFVPVSDLPSEDEEEDEQAQRGVTFDVASQAAGKEAVNEGAAKPKVRKGTGFVPVSDLPSDDEEEDEQGPKGVSFDASSQAAGNEAVNEGAAKPKVRKGTGFVPGSDLPSEDEEEDEQAPKGVTFDAASQAAGKEVGNPEAAKPKVRKGTGFVPIEDLPSEDEEQDEEEAQRGVTFDASAQAPGQKGGKEGEAKPKVRKGTGFVPTSDLPSEDEEEEEEAPKGVTFNVASQAAEAGKEANSKPKVRKGTGFVPDTDLPSDDEEEEEEEANKGVTFQVAEGVGNPAEPKTRVRKGTGFVSAEELPGDDDEDEDEDTGETSTEGGIFTPKAKAKKGARSFLDASDLPPDEDDPEVHFEAPEGVGDQGEGKQKVRKGTGFVSLSDITDMEEEGEEGMEEEAKPSDPEANANASVSFDVEPEAGSPGGKSKEKVRKGAGFVSSGELPPSDDEDHYSDDFDE